MRTIALAVAAGALLAATQANAGSFPVNNLTGGEPVWSIRSPCASMCTKATVTASISTAGMARAGTVAVSRCGAGSAGAAFTAGTTGATALTNGGSTDVSIAASGSDTARSANAVGALASNPVRPAPETAWRRAVAHGRPLEPVWKA